MTNSNSLVNPRRFLSLFFLQSLNALNDNILRNAIVVMIAFNGLKLAGLSTEISVNIVALCFILPYFLFSSYAGKLADFYSKVTLVRTIKYCELGIIVIIVLGFHYKNLSLLTLAITMMGVHSAFFSPIKYSILPQYFNQKNKLLLANGYIEFGTFVATLLGQTIGSWYMGNQQINILIAIMSLSTFSGLLLSYCMEKTPAIGNHSQFSWNVIKDSWHSYKLVTANLTIRNNILAISWFWVLGLVYTTQLSIFTKEYMGGTAHVFSVCIAIFSIAIGIGSVMFSKLAYGQIKRQFVIYGALGMSIVSLALLFVNSDVKTSLLTLEQFSHSEVGIVDYALLSIFGLLAGAYSVTCYNELQIISPIAIFSQVIAVNNILNALFMVIASIVCSILLIYINVWWLFFIVVCMNLIFVIWYWKVNRLELTLSAIH